MKQCNLTVESNGEIAREVFRMTLRGDLSEIRRPGQFVNLKIDGCYLRRPISVCDREGNLLTLIYKTVGEGTRKMSRMKPGTVIDTLTGLGNGFDLSRSGDTPLLIGGGVGVPPLFWLCRELCGQGKQVRVILGFRSAADVFGEAEFAKLGATVTVMTEDGSYGGHGFVTDGMRELSYSFFYTCGPMPMFRAIERVAVGSGEYSFEERMGCGFGACMGCSCQTKYGNKRICRDGPVLEREEIVW